MLLMIDNYDSFTYNLVQYFGELGADVQVYRNDGIDLDEIGRLAPDRIVLSPGPCTPLEAGVSVTAIDPAAMDPGVLSFVGPSGARARHLAIPAGAVVPSRLPAQVDWMVVDLNLAPPVALRYVARIVRARMPRRGAILTLKMNLPVYEKRLDEFVDFIRGFAPGPVIITQLAANRREVCVMAGA